ncbi:MAG: hypothetical protein GX038_01425 [Erysipelothrix sp.]|nr:hypothetical protein [Erysipelothrix sp.]
MKELFRWVVIIVVSNIISVALFSNLDQFVRGVLTIVVFAMSFFVTKKIWIRLRWNQDN